jgi:hypothetical protein
MGMTEGNGKQRVYASSEQLRYARLLDAGMRCGLVVLALGFIAYVTGWVPAHVPLEQMPEHWILPAADYLRATGMPEGWGWVQMLDGGDVLPLLGIAILSGVSGICFAFLVPVYFEKRDAVYCAIAVLEVAVLALAASGVLTAGH